MILPDASEINKGTDLLRLVGRELNRVADTGGGEWAGSCPFCGGDDRFRVQPYHTNGPRWFCRGCGEERWHSPIDFVMRREKLDFMGALAKLAGVENSTPTQAERKEEHKIQQIDREMWTIQAAEFADDCAANLFEEEGRKALEYLHRRGLQDETLKAWKIGYNPVEGWGRPEEWGLAPDTKIFIAAGITIPCIDTAGFHYLKIRRSNAEPKYLNLKGGEVWPYGLQTYVNPFTAFLFESELDVLLAWQTGFHGVGYASLPAGQPIKPIYAEFFNSIETVIVAFDEDPAGVKAAVELCKIPGFIEAESLPQGKDLTEYYQLGGNIFEWLYQQVERI